jgi:hypothetical protein
VLQPIKIQVELAKARLGWKMLRPLMKRGGIRK